MLKTNLVFNSLDNQIFQFFGCSFSNDRSCKTTYLLSNIAQLGPNKTFGGIKFTTKQHM